MFWIDQFSRKPVYEQIIEQTEKFILTGTLRPGDQMPSVRSLATTLSINPNTIQKAYNELDRKNIIQTVPGKGCFITESAHSTLCDERKSHLQDFDLLINELLLCGIQKEELINHIESAYTKGGKSND